MSLRTTDVRTPGAAAIAKKWGLPLTKVYGLISQGAKVEFEHNRDKAKAKQVARDHINERPDYYKRLRSMERLPIRIREETITGGISGLGYVSGSPAIGSNSYADTNAMSYVDENGNQLEWIRNHTKGHNVLKFKEFNPTELTKSVKKKLKEGLSTEPERDSETIGDYTGSSRKVMKVDEVNIAQIKGMAKKIPPKVKKAAKVGMTLANLATLGQVAGDAAEGRKGADPKRGMVAATSALPGAVGWGATGLHYTIKGYDKAKEHIRARQKAKMEEQGSPANPARYTERPMYERRNGNELSSGEVERGIYEDALDAASINAISREARVRDPKSLDAVLNVIHNRMGQKGYASSARGVLSQKGQFQAWGKGSAKGITDVDRQNIQKRWDDIVSGRSKDITGGANEFRTTSSRNRSGGTQIGGNTFYKTGSFAKNVPQPNTSTPTQVAKASAPLNVNKTNLADTKPKVSSAPMAATAAPSISNMPRVSTASPAPSPSPTTPSSSSYTVRQGDTLSGIAKRYGTDIGSLAKSSGISNPNRIMPGQSINLGGSSNTPSSTSTSTSTPTPSSDAESKKSKTPAQVNEIKAATVGRAVAKAAAERKDITSKKMDKKEIDKWWKRERLVRAGVEKLSGKSKVPASMDEEETKKDIRLMGNQKPDTVGYGAKGTTKTIHEETTMDTKDLINEALDDILENNLVSMKENLMTALQEKAMEKLEEKKKDIASNYFAQ